jgi:hypothetical protein
VSAEPTLVPPGWRFQRRTVVIELVIAALLVFAAAVLLARDTAHWIAPRTTTECLHSASAAIERGSIHRSSSGGAQRGTLVTRRGECVLELLSRDGSYKIVYTDAGAAWEPANVAPVYPHTFHSNVWLTTLGLISRLSG